MKEQKAELRGKVLKARDATTPEQRINWSLDAAENGAAASFFDRQTVGNGTIVSAFLPIRSEIDARPLMAKLAERGARLCLPVVLDKITIEFREMTRETKMVDTGFGTTGPVEGSPVLDPTILLMPLSVFDRTGGRIGYGAGHYDRAISRLIDKSIAPLLVGFAFALQEAEEVPAEDHDQPLDFVITERNVINCRQER